MKTNALTYGVAGKMYFFFSFVFTKNVYICNLLLNNQIKLTQYVRHKENGSKA